MTTRKKVWISVAIMVPIIVLVIIYALGITVMRLERVAEGLAHPEFPYNDYTPEELVKTLPFQTGLAKVETVRSPLETHALFIEKLKADDVDGAVECCFKKGDQEYMKDTFRKIKQEGRWDKVLSEISNIEEDHIFDNSAVYTYLTSYKDYEFKSVIGFTKTSSGTWMIDRL